MIHSMVIELIKPALAVELHQLVQEHLAITAKRGRRYANIGQVSKSTYSNIRILRWNHPLPRRGLC